MPRMVCVCFFLKAIFMGNAFRPMETIPSVRKRKSFEKRVFSFPAPIDSIHSKRPYIRAKATIGRMIPTKRPETIEFFLNIKEVYTTAYFFSRFMIISLVMLSRSYSGCQPQSCFAWLSSIDADQLSAMDCRSGSGS